ncbi:hypothetical protein E2C01_077723 [Portunus trituberculatus]|uniref:Uncharacterized protein n=1 Tax=Portunus trituberculatus TaxID=210409 RepID=A0A5B7IKY4_PORTR|nr:hypothetical protein [Portunus trituberculatus]
MRGEVAGYIYVSTHGHVAVVFPWPSRCHSAQPSPGHLAGTKARMSSNNRPLLVTELSPTQALPRHRTVALCSPAPPRTPPSHKHDKHNTKHARHCHLDPKYAPLKKLVGLRTSVGDIANPGGAHTAWPHRLVPPAEGT